MITSGDFRHFLELSQRLKVADFSVNKYEIEKSEQEGITQKYLKIEHDEIKPIIDEFDLTGDRNVSPDEFYNIIMAFYERR